MILRVLSVIFASMTSACAAPSAAHSCIQPEFRVVHVELGLVDIASTLPRSIVERSNWATGVPLPDEGRWVRLQLERGERVRLRSADGSTTPWVDPFADLGGISPEARETPDWAVGAVWYNVFPERFDNAEPRNDQGWPYGTPAEWGSDWFTATPDEFEASANRAISHPLRYADSGRRVRSPLAEVVFERRYGGDLQGVRRRLGHIEDLGATAIWFCPIFDAVSLHKYDATDHRHIDPHLAWPGKPVGSDVPFSTDPDEWGWTPADLEFVDAFLPEAKARGFRVILDGVWNHVGTAHPAFRDALERGSASPFADWFVLRSNQAGHVVGWKAWDRENGGLPAFRQVESDLAPGPKDHVFHVTRRWMDPNADGDPSDGIDGWRLDVANEVGLPFWRDWRAHVRAINPKAALFGELWFDGREYFGGQAFDAQMNYPLAFVLLPWLSGVQNPEIARDIERTMNHHPATVLAQMNLLASHDTARLVSLLANPGLEYDRDAGMNAAGFDRSRPSTEAYERLELAYAVLSALPGSPMVFAGDELGVWGGDDPENRKPLPWPDLAEDPELAQLANETTNRLSRVFRFRGTSGIGPVLRYGGTRLELQNDMLLIRRDLNGQVFLLYANPTDEPRKWGSVLVPPRSAKVSWLPGFHG